MTAVPAGRFAVSAGLTVTVRAVVSKPVMVLVTGVPPVGVKVIVLPVSRFAVEASGICVVPAGTADGTVVAAGVRMYWRASAVTRVSVGAPLIRVRSR